MLLTESLITVHYRMYIRYLRLGHKLTREERIFGNSITNEADAHYLPRQAHIRLPNA